MIYKEVLIQKFRTALKYILYFKYMLKYLS